MISVFVILTSLSATALGQQTNPGPYRLDEFQDKWAKRLMHGHLLNMTAEIVKDARYKLKHAEKIQEEHKHSVGYELGTIAAGILERFLFMLKLYRKYSNIDDMRAKKYYVDEFINVLQVMQGAYNEINLEKAMFFKVLKQYEGMDPSKIEQDRINRLMSKKPSMFKNNYRHRGLRSGLWSPGVEQFDVDGFKYH